MRVNLARYMIQLQQFQLVCDEGRERNLIGKGKQIWDERERADYMGFLYIQWYRIRGKSVGRKHSGGQRRVLRWGENGNQKESTRGQARTSVKGKMGVRMVG